MPRFPSLVAALLTPVLVAAAVGAPAPASAATGAITDVAAAGVAADVDTGALRAAISLDGVTRHARALQRIASANGNTRASGTPGYDASAAYVKKALTDAGYQVSEQTFTFPYYRELAPATLAQTSPSPITYQTLTMEFSESGDVTGRVAPTNDILVPPGAEPNSSTSGCQPEDFAPAGAAPQIALIQRGGCSYAEKVANAEAAGYDAVVIFNEGQPGRQALVPGSLFAPAGVPVVLLSYADGAALNAAAQAGPTELRVVTRTEMRPEAVTSNIIADSPGGDPGNVLVVGAHLDSVTGGPGVNDNGSGVAALVEIARQMATLKITPRQKVRFAFWGAEEFGSLGSQHYVDNLTDAQLGAIAANLNFDMIGSPNFVRFVYDGDGSDFGVPGPEGSGELERVFTSYFGARNLPVAPTVFDFRSDYVPFFDAGIPTGGLFSGAEGIKTAAEAKLFGGVAGQPYDPCYHKACDTITNVNNKVILELTHGAAHAVLTTALSEDLAPAQGRRAPARGADRPLRPTEG
ncbi:M28 family metallopeptidase [Nonomuraea sp. LPB2021202275-12-8]|uniref:M28 family metallopeptidase n=1 Tax=Nonomuraea sp. LPB2021202275-12-8 TaxID=3120159 RepID=UPI00300C0F2B